MSLSEKSIKEFKKLLEKKVGKEVSWAEAEDGANKLTNFFKILYDQAVIDKKRQIRLEKEPKGFHLEGKGYTCFICRRSISDEETWYDKWGIKCMICQNAINRKEIPASLAKNKDSWYSKYDLKDCFNLTDPTIRSWVKKGILKARVITCDGKGIHAQFFLIKDNKDFLPPKKLTESQLVKETKEDKDWYHSEPWYKFVDPFEHLKGYKIMDHLRFK